MAEALRGWSPRKIASSPKYQPLDVHLDREFEAYATRADDVHVATDLSALEDALTGSEIPAHAEAGEFELLVITQSHRRIVECARDAGAAPILTRRLL